MTQRGLVLSQSKSRMMVTNSDLLDTVGYFFQGLDLLGFNECIRKKKYGGTKSPKGVIRKFVLIVIPTKENLISH